MAKIAISYRRSDSQDITGRIFDRLAAHYGKDTVFRDIDSIQPGIDFRRQIADALRTTDVLLVVAGPAWLGQGKESATRMENEADPVRIEVETALKRDIPIIPVLVGGMRMPEIADLPASLKDFAYRHAVTVDGGRDFDHHIEGLIRALDRFVHASQKSDAAPPSPEIKVSPRSSALRTHGLIGGLGAVALVLAAVLWRTETKQTTVSLSLPSSQSASASATTPVSTTSAAPASAIATAPQPSAAAIPIAATPAFDCSKSHAVDELAVCHSGQLSYLDQQLNVLFEALRSQLSKDQETVLWAQERAWIKQRAACSSDEACIRNAYQSRIVQLQSWH